jgi:hypothetical protein
MAPAMCRTMSTALVVGSPVNIGTNKSTYQLLSDEQKARFNAIAPADNRNAAISPAELNPQSAAGVEGN